MSLIVTIFLLLCILSSANAEFAKKTYIIQMDKYAKPDTFSSHIEWYTSKVKSILSISVEAEMEKEERIIYTYQTAFHGMAAKLSREEAERLEAEEGVVAIFPDTKYQLHTTRSPTFLGLEPAQSTKVWSETLANYDVTVGVLDTGIWPESESFNDTGMRSVPSHWKGACETGREVSLGTGRKITGTSLYKGRSVLSVKKQYPLVYMGNINSSIPDPRSLCLEGTLDRRMVSGKIVICDRGISPRVQKGQVVKNAGGVGMILINTAANGEELVADCHLLPAVAVGEKEGKELKHYVLTSKKATATLDASSADASTPYDHGAGHINPNRALDPGLVYDIQPQDYFEFLCTQKLTPSELGVFAKYSNRTCRHSLASPGDLNYPAISVVFSQINSSSVLTVHRTATNVGPAVSKYHVVVSPFKGASVKVEPETLSFTKKYQKLSYKVTFTTQSRQTEPEFGGLVWKDGVHKVRSPIVLTYLTPI
ncbi:hypothetical protein ACSQ67_014026 [Phaseolus vulgaris]